MQKSFASYLTFAWISVLLGVSGLSAQDPAVQEANKRCLDCHGRAHIAKLSPTERFSMTGKKRGEKERSKEDFAKDPATRPELFLEYRKVYMASVHREIKCVDCHVDCETLPHPYRVQPARCESCHEAQSRDYAISVHGEAVHGGSKKAAHCADCHGKHDILSSANPQSRTYKLRQPLTCAKCHNKMDLMEAEGVRLPNAARQYIDSEHGRGLLVGGLIAAPSCNDCHGSHAILRSSDPSSSVSRENLTHTCGRCHSGVEAIYRDSVHGKLLAKGDKDAPVCASCHSAHSIIKPNEEAFKLESDERCGKCHEDRLLHYRETYHGKAMALGLPNVAACYDCHGHHDILPVDDPKSHLSDQNRLETCRKCHPGASGDFGGYIAHADHFDRKNHPVLYWTFIFMTSIVLGTFAFFGLHTLLWLIRSITFFVRDPKAFREAKQRIEKDEEQYVRFRPIDRFLHALVITSFLLLVATGMPLKFYDAAWAKEIVAYMGGLDGAAKLHRFGAILTFFYFATHIYGLLKSMFKKREALRNPETGRYSLKRAIGTVFGPDSLVPSLQDLRDFWAHQKWFFGRGERPQFDRWTYWEKFDYLGVFWGVTVIGISGLVMWFPVQTTLLLPGWVINVALIVHSDEALLAAGFIFAFHFFNVHFRVEKFPIDPVIFSGRISKAEFLHERKRWWDRLSASGKLPSMKVKDEWKEWKPVIHPLGFLAFGIGTILLILILWAMGVRLLGSGA